MKTLIRIGSYLNLKLFCKVAFSLTSACPQHFFLSILNSSALVMVSLEISNRIPSTVTFSSKFWRTTSRQSCRASPYPSYAIRGSLPTCRPSPPHCYRYLPPHPLVQCMPSSNSITIFLYGVALLFVWQLRNIKWKASTMHVGDLFPSLNGRSQM